MQGMRILHGKKVLAILLEPLNEKWTVFEEIFYRINRNWRLERFYYFL